MTYLRWLRETIIEHSTEGLWAASLKQHVLWSLACPLCVTVLCSRFPLASALLCRNPKQASFSLLKFNNNKKKPAKLIFMDLGAWESRKKNVPVLSQGFLLAVVERRMAGEDSSSAHEPCTELARVRRYRWVWPHLGEWMGGSSVWPGALGQTSRWSLIIFLSCSS